MSAFPGIDELVCLVRILLATSGWAETGNFLERKLVEIETSMQMLIAEGNHDAAAACRNLGYVIAYAMQTFAADNRAASRPRIPVVFHYKGFAATG